MLTASVGKITSVFPHCVCSLRCNYSLRSRVTAISRRKSFRLIHDRSRSTGKPVGQKFDCGHGWWNLINKRAPRGSFYRAHATCPSFSRDDTWLVKMTRLDRIRQRHVFNKTRRARDRKSRGPESKPGRDQPGLVEHAESAHPPDA